MELKHAYGANIHLFDDLLASTLLTKLSHPSTKQPELNNIIRKLYLILLQSVINSEFKSESTTSETRMTKAHPNHLLDCRIVDRHQKAVCVDLARAGILPSQTIYDFLNEVLIEENVRQDHIFASRQTSGTHQVTGTHFGETKIGGDVKGALVLIADPMGATGGTINTTLSHYKNTVTGPARKYIAMHLIVTPEYLKNVTQAHPDVIIYSLRLDRGLSSPKVLQSGLGEFWNEEKGLNEFSYIVPGAGGLGEIMNNSYV